MSKQLFILILLSLFWLSGFNARSENKTAILVGIDKYEGLQLSPFRLAAVEAQNMSRILSENGYNCVTLVDSAATKEQITETFINLEQQTNQTGELELFVFSFSGRGTRIPDDIQADETQDGFDECILPSDAVAGNPRSYIRDDDVARWMRAVRAKQVILILDCAFWGDDADANVKGFGKLPESGEQSAGSLVILDGIEITDGLPMNAVILAAALPDARAYDGNFTTKLLEACVTEATDQDGNRIISFNEAYQYAHRQLQGQQPPRLVGAKDADIPLSPLPPLSRLRVESEPTGAAILIYAPLSGATPDSEAQDTFVPVQLEEPRYTPAEAPLKQGMYQVRVQKPGYFIPEAKEVAIVEYDTLYPVEPFQLKPITVVGQTSIINTSGEPVAVENTALTLHVKALHEVSPEFAENQRGEQADRDIYQETLPADGRFRFEPAVHSWLEVGKEYELNVTGGPVLNVKPVRFTYDGYTDINADMTVTLDDIPPVLVLSPNEATFQSAQLIVGEELRGSLKAKDSGIGLADTIEIQLQPPDNQAPVPIPASDISFQPPDTYQFRYILPETPAAAGMWQVLALTLQDKAGNRASFAADQIKATFLVFASRFLLGKYYFDAGDYTEALVQLEQVSPKSDDAHYLTALAYYQQKDLTKALEVFQTIEAKTNYLGHARQKEMPQMPRRMVNKVWGRLLDGLDAHRTDAEYVSLLAAAAEELGRSYEAEVYREYVKRLR
ncbi:tetratricopeptide repeat protein [Candidatus Poribacteria bacterium]|nr:tetratricopeptide repeat protein [Candidatus Poribacteria bacterium]